MIKTIETLPDLSHSISSLYQIGSMKLFLFDPDRTDGSTLGVDKDCYTGLMKMTSQGAVGWGTFTLPHGEHPIDLVKWASIFMSLKGLSIPDAFLYIQSNRLCWGEVRGDLAAAALSDLADNIEYPLMNEPFQMEENELLQQSLSYFSF